MTWTRLDDLWTDDPVVNDLSFEDRWHYLALIQFCSRTKKYDGRVRAIDAYRCSDHPDTRGAIARMAALGLLTIDGTIVVVNRVDEHIPPPSVRENSERTKVRMRRSRAHKAGDHSECLPSFCKAAVQRVTAPVTAEVTRNTRSGQVRSGSLQNTYENEAEVETHGRQTLIAEADPDKWPTDDHGVHWRTEIEDKGFASVGALMDAEGMNEAQATKCWAAAYPGWRP